MVITIRKVEMDEGKSRNRINLFFVIIAFCFFLSGCGAKAEKKTDVKSLTLAVFEYGSQQRDSDLRKRVNQYNGEHPERSLILLDEQGLKLTDDERTAIGCHHRKDLTFLTCPLRRLLSLGDCASTGAWKREHAR